MRIVIDTNVFISSFLGKGFPRRIIDLWKDGNVTLCLSREIIEEYVEVLRRLGIVDEAQELLQLFRRGAHVVFSANPRKLSPVCSDPDDNIFFECASELEAGYIVSGDKAVLAVEDFAGIKVLSSAAFVEEVGKV